MGPTATLAPTATEPPTTVPALTPTGPALNPTVAGGTVAGAAAPTGSPTFDGTVDNAGSTTASDEGSSSAWIWVILVVVVIGSIGFILHQRRCRAAAADRLFEGGARSQSRAARGSSVPTAVDNQACDATDLHCQAIATDASVGGGGGGDGLRATCEDGYVEGHTAYGGPTYAVPFDDPSQPDDYLMVGGATMTDHATAANPPTRPSSNLSRGARFTIPTDASSSVVAYQDANTAGATSTAYTELDAESVPSPAAASVHTVTSTAMYAVPIKQTQSSGDRPAPGMYSVLAEPGYSTGRPLLAVSAYDALASNPSAMPEDGELDVPGERCDPPNADR